MPLVRYRRPRRPTPKYANGESVAQAPRAETRLHISVFRVGAVLAASAPVILKTSKISAAELTIGVCNGVTGAGPFLLTVGPWGQLLSWAELLLPAVLAGLLLTASRRTTTLGVTAICIVIVLRLFSVFFTPEARDPGAGQLLPFAEPWPAMACYVVAVIALLLTARSPLRRARSAAVLWGLAMAASAWTVGRLSLLNGDPISFGWSAYTQSTELLWKQPWGWSCKAEVDGVLIVLIALAAAASTVLTDRMRILAALATSMLLVLAAFEGFLMALILSINDRLETAVPRIQWHLLAAAVLVTATAWRKRALSTTPELPHPS
ncbi:hypothetical protein [Nonomuraea sp. NPDC050786]|uniref:hypothetical protein n=1 Tax=Nonomuraea sp. NPDC050786 TaxID=3154840 RepID=UPI0033CDE8F3